MLKYFEIHKHTEYSPFDGFGKIREVLAHAKKLKYPAIAITDHGKISGLIQLYNQCREMREDKEDPYDIKPILGYEAYFQPKFDKEKDTYHLCIYAINKEGWQNMMRIQSLSEHETFYKKPVVTFETLKKYSEGIIITTACLGGYIPKLIAKGKNESAIKWTKKFKKVFGDNFYLELQPISVIEKGKDIQKKINKSLMKLGETHDIKCIVTTDSHFTTKDEFTTFRKMFEMRKSDWWKSYKGRHMHGTKSIEKLFRKMHGKSAQPYVKNLHEIYDKVENDILDGFDIQVPSLVDSPEKALKECKKLAKKRMKKEGHTSKKHIDRIKREFKVIEHHGFQDLFLFTADYVNFAKDNGIAVGPGRGSVDNSYAAYAMGITDVDAVFFDNDFDRFLRMDKAKMPDIDLDFCQRRRPEVIKYLVDKYPGRAVQVATYSRWKTDGLCLELSKLYNMTTEELTLLKKLLRQYTDDNDVIIDLNGIAMDTSLTTINARFKDIVTHFSRLYGNLRYYGTHAAAVVVMNDPICERIGAMRFTDKSKNILYKSPFDLDDLETLNVLKVDILGLANMTMIQELERDTGVIITNDMLDDEATLAAFNEGDCEGIFQMSERSARELQSYIGCESIEDIFAAISLNRPGPLEEKMHEEYAGNKQSHDSGKKKPWHKYTSRTHNSIIYQEQAMRICREIGLLPWDITDKIIKNNIANLPAKKRKEWEKMFVKGAKKTCKMKPEESKSLFRMIAKYFFNRGHATGYGLIAYRQMYYKVNFPMHYWRSAIRKSSKHKRDELRRKAVDSGCILLIPHVNGPAVDDIVTFDGEDVIQEGLISINNVGEKAAQSIQAERKARGDFSDLDDFLDRTDGRVVNKKTIEALENLGALEFDQDKFIRRVVKVNSKLKSIS